MKKSITSICAILLLFGTSACSSVTNQEAETPTTQTQVIQHPTEQENDSGSTGKQNQSESQKKISNYLETECQKAFSPYYQLLEYQMTDYQETAVNGSVEATFAYKLIYKNYEKDPDTVDYIKEAKANGDPHYQQLYNEYGQPKEMNFELKAVLDPASSISLFSNTSPKGAPKWESVVMTDYILSK
ncbi:hypothetical protein [Brevibacillus reuszeri]|uniref:hypothetical protein n=1 Tax=Brevibacillus reuszeri TaxID=54915 RepID=UPI003D23ADEB